MLLILTGTGRSGTTYMVGVLRRVYGFGLSAEPKDVLQICRFADQHDLNEEEQLRKVIHRMAQSPVFKHAIQKGIITTVNESRILHYVVERTVEGVVLAMFRYVAEIRGANSGLPGFKDPVILRQVQQLSRYLPNVCYINMIRKGEDVAGSTLKFNWGATNSVAGVIDWSNMLNNAYRHFANLVGDRVLHLPIENAQSNLEGFVHQLDHFVELNFGISNKGELRHELEKSFKPIKEYGETGFRGFLIGKLAQNLNYRLGYVGTSLPSWQEGFYHLVALPFLLTDRVIRGVRILRRKFRSL